MIWTAFLLGFLGSFHCLGMCGPIALAVSAKDNKRFLSNKLAYNFGRTLTYSVLGAVIGFLGFSMALAGLQQWVSIVLGSVILLMAFFYKRAEGVISQVGMFGLVYQIKAALSSLLKNSGKQGFFLTGMVNGLLPCGMVYIALVASLALQDPFWGAAYMFFFGLGTMPLLLVLMISGKVFPVEIRQKFMKGMPYLAMFIGVLFIVRGLGLGVHMVSPKLPQWEGKSSAQTEMTICNGD